VTPYSAGAWAYGGIPRLADTIARGLARRGHDVTVCTTDARDSESRLASPAGYSRWRAWPAASTDGVECLIFPNISNRLAYRLQLFLPLGLDKYLKRNAGRFDVAHLHACRNVPGVIAARHLRRQKVPYVIAPNGTAPRIERRRLSKLAFDLVAGRRVLDDAARVVAVSKAECRQLADLGVPAEAIRLIPNPLDLSEFAQPPVPGVFRGRFGLPAGRVVLFLGKLTPRKRLDVLVRAFARTARTDTFLVIAGNDMGALGATQSIVRTLGLDNRTFFTGLLRGQERLDALAAADVVVYPSEHEIFGLVPLEALLSGTPVVVADDSGCGEIVGATGGGRVVALGDAVALAGAIDEVLSDPARWRREAADAATRVRTLYGDEVVCARLEQLYCELVTKPAPERSGR
jgi:glycosyltransferase involved in cell wall biosynthesis